MITVPSALSQSNLCELPLSRIVKEPMTVVVPCSLACTMKPKNSSPRLARVTAENQSAGNQPAEPMMNFSE